MCMKKTKGVLENNDNIWIRCQCFSINKVMSSFVDSKYETKCKSVGRVWINVASI